MLYGSTDFVEVGVGRAFVDLVAVALAVEHHLHRIRTPCREARYSELIRWARLSDGTFKLLDSGRWSSDF